MGMAAVGHYRVLPGVTAAEVFTLSDLIGQGVNKLRSRRDLQDSVAYPEAVPENVEEREVA